MRLVPPPPPPPPPICALSRAAMARARAMASCGSMLSCAKTTDHRSVSLEVSKARAARGRESGLQTQGIDPTQGLPQVQLSSASLRAALLPRALLSALGTAITRRRSTVGRGTPGTPLSSPRAPAVSLSQPTASSLVTTGTVRPALRESLVIEGFAGPGEGEGARFLGVVR
jgi:hypothetical protein